jgi:chromosome segregation ATPase
MLFFLFSCPFQTERDEAMSRARRNSKQAERTAQQLVEVKAQLTEVKAQLAEATDYKITALERTRKLEDMQSRIIELEAERDRLHAQVSVFKTRARSAVECSTAGRLRDEHAINVSA